MLISQSCLCDIFISMPPGLHLAINIRKIDLSRVEYLVPDEPDKLFELGLLKQIDSVVKACSNTSIICSLFSSTLPDFLEDLARTIICLMLFVLLLSGRILLQNQSSKSWFLLEVKKVNYLHFIKASWSYTAFMVIVCLAIFANGKRAHIIITGHSQALNSVEHELF
ncbi:hypothetical protein SLEP1_g39017 [Rubroshorea leprosula]|uniref:Uncharacterized protein n=1 Tax=Rubroshorea leprosula TaxID=152421 RepID=A0AAV5KZ40_9ROSI|nr:hypothetical protein SLEP1_g39017 [Rubroshorea leprosula]